MAEPETITGSNGSVVVKPKVDIRSNGSISAGGKSRRFLDRLGYGPKDRTRVIREALCSRLRFKCLPDNSKYRVAGGRETAGSSQGSHFNRAKVIIGLATVRGSRKVVAGCKETCDGRRAGHYGLLYIETLLVYEKGFLFTLSAD